MSEDKPPVTWEEKLKILRRDKLRSLLYDSEIARAVEDGRPRDLYKLLLAKRKKAGLAEQPEIDELLDNRRLFAEPIKKPPTMFTMNGVGTSLYGKQELDPNDGTYIATLFFTLVFLPVFPLGQYLVSPADGNKWYFHAKVPVGRKMRSWRRASLAGAVVLACAAIGIIYYTHAFTKLQLVNGLDVPLTVQLDKATPMTVPPGQTRALNSVSSGRRHLLTRTVTGEMVEEFDADVPSTKDVIAYNILGAAPLYAEGIIYYAKGKEPNHPSETERPPLQHYFGQRFIIRDNVAYVFKEPPKTISMSEHATKETRWRFALDTGGWAATLRILNAENKLTEVADLATAIARVEPDNEEAVGNAMGYTRAARSMNAALALGSELIKRAPQSAAAHRLYQSYMIEAGRAAESRAMYRQLHSEHPDSPLYGYLHARAELSSEAVKLYASLVEHSPNDPYFRRGFAYSLFQTRRFAEALPQFDRFIELDPKHSIGLLDAHARTLIATGRKADAVKLVADVCDEHARQNKLEPSTIFLYARVAALAPGTTTGKSPEVYLKALVGSETLTPEIRLWYLSQTGPAQIDDQLLLSTINTTLRTKATIARDAGVKTNNALKLAGSLPAKELESLPEPTLVLLAGEAVRAGNRQLAKQLLDAAINISGDAVALKSFVLDGRESPELADLDLELQAVLSFLRGDKNRALADDILQGVVTRAARH
jgi:Flp pilus assembly protein TadD